MSSYSESFEADASFYLSEAGDEADHPQQVKFIEDQLKELEERIKHVDTTIKEKINFIEYSERLKIYLQHRIEPVHSSYNIFFRDNNAL